AGEHDKRAGRVDLRGDRQEQRHRQRRADPWEDADRRAERYADDGV
ncbi:MAG: hypothetical protein AVDCRST_MAG88-1673, partial [uncultured Thermomicrobiales bacterium]